MPLSCVFSYQNKKQLQKHPTLYFIDMCWVGDCCRKICNSFSHHSILCGRIFKILQSFNQLVGLQQIHNKKIPTHHNTIKVFFPQQKSCKECTKSFGYNAFIFFKINKYHNTIYRLKFSFLAAKKFYKKKLYLHFFRRCLPRKITIK